MFVKDGTGNYSIDDATFEVGPGAIYFTNPGHFKSFECVTLEDVTIITFTESFLKENVHQDIFAEFPFLLAETVLPKVLQPEAFSEFEVLYRQVRREFDGNSAYKQKLVASFFVVLLLKIKEYFWNDYSPIYEGNRSSQIVKIFKGDMEAHYRQLGVKKYTSKQIIKAIQENPSESRKEWTRIQSGGIKRHMIPLSFRLTICIIYGTLASEAQETQRLLHSSTELWLKKSNCITGPFYFFSA